MRSKIVLLIGATALLVLMISFGLYRSNSKGQAILVKTDSTPVTLEINDKTIIIDKKTNTLNLPQGTYNYRAASGKGSEKILLYGFVDTTKDPRPAIDLTYRLFTDNAIVDGLCQTEETSETARCPYRNTLQNVTYLADHSWAIAKVAIAGPADDESAPEATLVALKVTNGGWEKIAGPFVYVRDFKDYLPAEVFAEIAK